MAKKLRHIGITIDKLTRSVENAITGDSFPTEIHALLKSDISKSETSQWNFDWQKELTDSTKAVYKLVLADSPKIILGLISIQDKGDHIYMHLIESNKQNRGAGKIYLGVPGNLVAFACKLAFEKGYEGYVSFESKTKLIQHYHKILGAQLLFGNVMAIETPAALKLVNQYFPKNL